MEGGGQAGDYDDTIRIAKPGHITEDAVLDGNGGQNTLQFGDKDSYDLTDLDEFANIHTLDLRNIDDTATMTVDQSNGVTVNAFSESLLKVDASDVGEGETKTITFNADMGGGDLIYEFDAGTVELTSDSSLQNIGTLTVTNGTLDVSEIDEAQDFENIENVVVNSEIILTGSQLEGITGFEGSGTVTVLIEDEDDEDQFLTFSDETGFGNASPGVDFNDGEYTLTMTVEQHEQLNHVTRGSQATIEIEFDYSGSDDPIDITGIEGFNGTYRLAGHYFDTNKINKLELGDRLGVEDANRLELITPDKGEISEGRFKIDSFTGSLSDEFVIDVETKTEISDVSNLSLNGHTLKLAGSEEMTLGSYGGSLELSAGSRLETGISDNLDAYLTNSGDAEIVLGSSGAVNNLYIANSSDSGVFTFEFSGGDIGENTIGEASTNWVPVSMSMMTLDNFSDSEVSEDETTVYFDVNDTTIEATATDGTSAQFADDIRDAISAADGDYTDLRVDLVDETLYIIDPHGRAFSSYGRGGTQMSGGDAFRDQHGFDPDSDQLDFTGYFDAIESYTEDYDQDEEIDGALLDDEDNVLVAFKDDGGNVVASSDTFDGDITLVGVNSDDLSFADNFVS
ncbi:hypothetical protein Dthio_PD2994 [Desulfonatronospira thiodismutans ASO3-1]|uniref:Uncharacterized protein n=1 Tax=Desulfonatronospira thiodismutans ASO3-1 TaxID=555779 RepID=D6SLK7_9BACT|nr:hypothetical protein [Desulfonatronospira thiodismutans]EFI35568.1 hypothetical protein Dthio_PD2994 [Desulfonatronospira thiodismutans ASO3-1]